MNKSMINAHTHIFSHKHVPPYLAKKILPWPFFYLVPMSRIVGIVKFFSYSRDRNQNAFNYLKAKKIFYRIRFFYNKFYHANFLTYYIICPAIWIFLFVPTLIVLSTAVAFFINRDFVAEFISYCMTKINSSLFERDVVSYISFIHGLPFLVKAILLFIGLGLFKSGRNLVSFLISRLRFLPGKETRALYERYINIAQFARYERQINILDALSHNFPDKTRFIVLPMDMDYMKAGKCQVSYPEQLKELETIKLSEKWNERFFPFIFAHPERIKEDSLYEAQIQKGLSGGIFAGIKIYPALGYFPFEKELLATYLFAAENGIPIITHCIRGVIYYRGKRKKEWYHHPLFKNQENNPIELYSFENSKYAAHFTHPLNYVALLEPYFLMSLLDTYNDPALDTLFKFDRQNRTLGKNLSKLKLCFGHFGGEDEWRNYLEHDRTVADTQFIQKPDFEIDLSDPKKIFSHYFSTSWYTIIRSMMHKYDNVFADISFILHDIDIVSLLKETLRVDKVKDRVLFGTDFYVVRNHASDKELFLNLKGRLSEEDFERIAYTNNEKFLTTSFSTDN